MSSVKRCHAVERGLRCNATPPAGSKWCPWHEELQAKSLKTYKRFSFELEGYQECQITLRCIKLCDNSQELQEWSECLRKKWVLTQRTVEARIKHHKLFYAGGDVSHQAFIDNLTRQKTALEEKLLRIDERAYELLKHNEQAGWLDQHVPVDPICEEPVANLETKLSHADTSPSSPVLSAVDEVSQSSVSSPDEEGDTDIFSDVESQSGSSNSCNSACCETAANLPMTYRSKVLAYLDYSTCFTEEEDRAFATKYMDNIMRYTISRIPSLLVRARRANCKTVKCFLNSEELQEPEFGRLWRGLKYNNVHAEGKLSVSAICNALCDAEQVGVIRKGACLDVLGGKVWKDALPDDLSRRGWDHFYRLTSCSGCALSVTNTFKSWSANRLLSQPNSRYPTWFDAQDSPAEGELRACGVILCGSYRKGRLGSMEHVKPKKKGMRSVWIERDTRNWCFLRMLPTQENLDSVRSLSESSLAVYVWPVKDASNVEPDGVTWVSRLRTGYNATDRRNARWTTESTFHFTDKTHERLLSTSPETYFHKGKPFADPSLDFLVVDTGTVQSFESFLHNIALKLGYRDHESTTEMQERPLLDRALYLGRHMFREVV